MKKTILIIILFIAVAILLAFSFSTFFISEKKLRYPDCVLLQNTKTKAIDCFGCYNNVCKDATTDWVIYQKTGIGIPYACFKSAQGCTLAQ